MDKIIVTLAGLAGIILTYWFFLTRQSKKMTVTDSEDSAGLLQADIVVEGGYSPEVIVIPQGRTTKIHFLRKDPSSCLEEVVLSGFKVRKYLPLNQKVTIELTPQKKGEFAFACGMNMYHGKIIVQ